MFKSKFLTKNKRYTLIIFVFFTQICLSQIYEVGISYGKSNFIGDVGNTSFINPKDDIFGGVLKWNRSPRHAYRISFLRSKLSGFDIHSKDPRRIERGFSFETPINEFSIGMEFNFFDYDLHDYNVLFTPYIFSGLMYTKFDEQILQNGNLISTNSSKSTFGIPMIIGLKHRFYDNIILSIEIGARYTFTDKIDGNNLNNENLSYNFGNINNNDWYMFSNFNITYTFGKKPCYCNID